jgi:hypothetical protein
VTPYQLIFAAGDVGDLHVVGGGRQIFEFLASEDVNGSKMDLGVTVFASLGRGHFDDLAGAAFDDDEAVLPQGGTLHWVSGRSASIGTIESVLMLCIQVSQVLAERVGFTAREPWWGNMEGGRLNTDLRVIRVVCHGEGKSHE